MASSSPPTRPPSGARPAPTTSTTSTSPSRAPGADSVAVVFRMRNSLLNTTLLYDLMLGDRGTTAFGWMADTLATIGGAVSLGQWAMGRLGMEVSVSRWRGFQPVGRIPDTGPVAWKDVAITVPAPRDGPVQVQALVPGRRMAHRSGGGGTVSPGRAPCGPDRGGPRCERDNWSPEMAGRAGRARHPVRGDVGLGSVHRGLPNRSRPGGDARPGSWPGRATTSNGCGGPGSPVIATPPPSCPATSRWRTPCGAIGRRRDSTERLFYATRVPVR